MRICEGRVGQTCTGREPNLRRRQLKVTRVRRGGKQVHSLKLEWFLAIDTHLAELVRKLANTTGSVASCGGLAITGRIYVVRLSLLWAVVRSSSCLLWLLLLLLLLLRELVLCDEPGSKELSATQSRRLRREATICGGHGSVSASVVGLRLTSGILATFRGLRGLCWWNSGGGSGWLRYGTCPRMFPLGTTSRSLCNVVTARTMVNSTSTGHVPTKRYR
jgi:hypothetical protein